MIIRVRAKPSAKSQARVVKIDSDFYDVFTNQPAQNGQANQSIITLLAKHFGVLESAISLKSGIHSKHKVFEVDL
jgi:uncharacterized protein YggU (UPF0235/DUF167 family)